jgi:hypothetical protein
MTTNLLAALQGAEGGRGWRPFAARAVLLCTAIAGYLAMMATLLAVYGVLS